ncbi:hypothetical protein, partial [Deinococcus sp. 23YEL01]|uniref:hypothetical protein n=1 Tax=Deinococcus sp. 23YEL01 TaxID=2745871 RepID=UPI001E327BFA
VLACTDCNRGEGGKFAALPAPHLIERLHQRNEGLIASNHPLRETLMNQTGMSEIARRSFITDLEREALPLLIHRWEPSGL